MGLFDAFVSGMDKFKRGMVRSAVEGENVGIFLKDIIKDDAGTGDILER